jgi:Domain of unknown function (DUF4272)
MESSPAPEALQRKQRTEALLRAEGVPINEHLPMIESEDEAVRRSVEEIAHRALSLLVVAGKGHGVGAKKIDEVVRAYRLDAHFTPKERAFLEDPSASEHQRVQFVWRYEAAWALLWSLGYVAELAKPTKECDFEYAVDTMIQRTAEQFIADAKLRPLAEILDQCDLIYRYRWAIVDAGFRNLETPAGLNASVAVERHHALNWLIGYMADEWDDMTTDT